MIIDGKKVTKSDAQLKNHNMKKVAIQTKEGKTIWVMPHMVATLEKFYEANQVRRNIRETPKELLQPIYKPIKVETILPKMETTKPAPVFEKPVRKVPVRSKSVKK